MDDDKPRSVRRFGRKDQKAKLDPVEPLFPDDTPQAGQQVPAEAGSIEDEADFKTGFPDLDSIPIPDVDSGALEALSQLSEASVRPLVIVPESERFPPVKPPEQPVVVVSQAQDTQSKRPTQSRKPAKKSRRYNLLSLIFLLGIIGAAALFVVIWQDPYSALNPFPPPTRFVQVTATPGGAALVNPPDTPNADLTAEPAAVNTQPASTATSPFIMDDDVVYIANENGRGCDWASIAGTVTGLNGEAINGFGVQITGSGIEEKVFSGSALTFGPGGFELPLGGAPLAAEFEVQLLSTAGIPLSDVYPITTQGGCENNVTIINFVQVNPL